jgi:hypothetical protein
MYFCIDDVRYGNEGLVAYPKSWLRTEQGSWLYCSAAMRNSIAPVVRPQTVPPWLELRTRWRLFSVRLVSGRRCGVLVCSTAAQRMRFLAVKALQEDCFPSKNL